MENLGLLGFCHNELKYGGILGAFLINSRSGKNIVIDTLFLWHAVHLIVKFLDAES